MLPPNLPTHLGNGLLMATIAVYLLIMMQFFWMIQDHLYHGASKEYKSFIRVDSSVSQIHQDPGDVGQLFLDQQHP